MVLQWFTGINSHFFCICRRCLKIKVITGSVSTAGSEWRGGGAQACSAIFEARSLAEPFWALLVSISGLFFIFMSCCSQICMWFWNPLYVFLLRCGFNTVDSSAASFTKEDLLLIDWLIKLLDSETTKLNKVSNDDSAVKTKRFLSVVLDSIRGVQFSQLFLGRDGNYCLPQEGATSAYKIALYKISCVIC